MGRLLKIIPNMEPYLTKAIVTHRQQNEQRQEQLQQAELTFRHQIADHEKNAQDNWIKPQIWEREMAEQSQEVARLKHRLDGMEGKRLLEGYRRRRRMPGSPETQNPPRRDPETDATFVSYSSSDCTKNADKDKDSVDPWGPPPLTGRFCMPYPRGAPPPWTIRHIHLLNLGSPEPLHLQPLVSLVEKDWGCMQKSRHSALADVCHTQSTCWAL
ncbi:transport and Golgi organization protein 1 homolog isoform X2 [Prionailurus viverrinus]|uniref:transport and Golgi organization protein 1 homolog isoform X2 n=1 Tax=Prionailurus viverrinus TaxID=61388 RepID=UPI001FF2471A|nr:transport and Golgi organization protein 1 homolog isoform X2 [Prionailurus viverrinus]